MDRRRKEMAGWRREVGQMKEIVRTFNGHNIRVIVQKGVEWFLAQDICDILGIAESRSSTRDFPDMEKGVHTMHTPGGEQKRLFVNEPGLYRLIFKSRKPEAESFKTWVFEEVLPSIRKTGKYEIPKDTKERSTEGRNLLTGQWKRQGVSKPVEYGSLTKESYRQIFNNPDIRKAGMDLGQVLKLTAFESVEAWKLSENPENALGFSGCRESISETAGLLEEAKNQNFLRNSVQA
jgi:prophage antirepressor-like protein